jgi:hypothetical protein
MKINRCKSSKEARVAHNGNPVNLEIQKDASPKQAKSLNYAIALQSIFQVLLNN